MPNGTRKQLRDGEGQSRPSVLSAPPHAMTNHQGRIRELSTRSCTADRVHLCPSWSTSSTLVRFEGDALLEGSCCGVGSIEWSVSAGVERGSMHLERSCSVIVVTGHKLKPGISAVINYRCRKWGSLRMMLFGSELRCFKTLVAFNFGNIPGQRLLLWSGSWGRLPCQATWSVRAVALIVCLCLGCVDVWDEQWLSLERLGKLGDSPSTSIVKA